VLEHRAIFVNSLRSSSDEIRRRIFDAIEQHHAHDFGNGRAGIELYEELLYALRDSGMPEVMKEFERRFSPLLSPSPLHSNAHLGPRKGMTDQDLDVTTVLHHRPLIKEFPLLTPSPSHSNAHLGPRKGMTDQDQHVTTALHHRPRRDWGRKSILYVAAFSSIAMLGVFVICTSFVSSPDVFAQAVNGRSPAGAPQAQRPPTPTSKLLQPSHDPKEVGSPRSPTNVTPSAGSRQPAVRAVPRQVDRSVSGARNTPSMSVQAGRPRAVERPALSSDDTYLEGDLSEPISFDRPLSSSRRQGRSPALY
jgi:hypothetical protein